MQPALHLDTHRVLEHAARSSKHAARSRELGTEGVEHVKCIRGEPTWPWGKHPRRTFRPNVYISRIEGTGTGEPRARARASRGRRGWVRPRRGCLLQQPCAHRRILWSANQHSCCMPDPATPPSPGNRRSARHRDHPPLKKLPQQWSELLKLN